MMSTKMMVVSVLVGMLGCSDGPAPVVDYAVTGNSGTGAAGSGEPAGSGGAGGTGSVGEGAGTGGAAGMSGGAGGSSGDGASAGTGAIGGAGAGMGGSGGSGGSGSAPKPKCLQKDSQVVVIGDSYINWVSHTMPQDLKTVSGQNWRNYAIGAASMGSGGASFIPDQLDTAVAEDPDMTTLVMDGGGNDILVASPDFPGGADCKNRADAASVPVCQMIVKLAIDTATDLMDHVVELGVKNVIFFFYPEVPEGTLIGGAHPRAILKYALPMARDACEGAEARTGGKLKCHFIDTIPLFKGHDDWFAPTDIHENSLGSMAITKEIWRVMQDNCIAQKAPNTCCEN